MLHKRFNEILANMCCTDRMVDFTEGFQEMWQMKKAWKSNMAAKFNPWWINVLGKSMMEWFNQFAPSFMCVGRKPYPFGKDWHSIFCTVCIVFQKVAIVEGKDQPRQLQRKK